MKKEVFIYCRNEIIYIVPINITNDGFGKPGDHVFKTEISNLENISYYLSQGFKLSKTGIVNKGWSANNDALLKSANLRSFRTFKKKAKLVIASCEYGIIYLRPLRNETNDLGWYGIENVEIRCDADSIELGKLVVEALNSAI